MQNDFLQYMRHLYDKTARQMRFQGPIEDFYDWKPKPVENYRTSADFRFTFIHG